MQDPKPPAPPADPALLAAVRAEAKDGKLSCARALALANEHGVPPIKVGQAADEAGIKIRNCQLGCF